MLLHLQVAYLEGDKSDTCLKCLQIHNVHWTEVTAHCESCKHHSMHFSHFTEVDTIDKFKDFSTKCAEDFSSITVTYEHDGIIYMEVRREFSEN